MNSEIENHSAKISQEFPQTSACTWVVVLHCRVFWLSVLFFCVRQRRKMNAISAGTIKEDTKEPCSLRFKVVYSSFQGHFLSAVCIDWFFHFCQSVLSQRKRKVSHCMLPSCFLAVMHTGSYQLFTGFVIMSIL